MATDLTHDESRDTIYQIPIKHLAEQKVFNLGSGKPTTGVFRFVSCDAFVTKGILSIVERSCLEDLDYSAVSYVWRGNPISGNGPTPRAFSTPVPDDEIPGDPISIDVLRVACLAALAHGSSYIWLDQLCILQTNEDDKMWQIQRIQHIYRQCKQCLILLGGLQKLCRLEEETAWIHRAWTLQEAISPPSAYVLFEWTLGSTSLTGLTIGNIIELEQARSAIIRLGELLQAASVGWLILAGTKSRITVKIFGTERPAISALMGAMELQDPEARETAIWRSALMRTSSKPVDMVFSIMGLFNVFLNPREYGKYERERATLDLVREILANGGGMTWMLASLRGSFLATACTILSFPETCVSGNALFKTPDGVHTPQTILGGTLSWSLCNAARGSMDDFGRLTITGGFSPITTTGVTGRRSSKYRGFEYWTLLRFENGEQSEASLLGNCEASHGLVIGEVSHYNLLATGARRSRGSTAIMLAYHLQRRSVKGAY